MKSAVIKFAFTFWTTALFAITAHAQTTAFSYQGSLKDGANPANGTFQMQFKLFDSLSGGTQIGSTLTDVAVTAADGVFSVKLDFGANALSGANRFIEIAVRRNSGESYVVLTPREQIASAPYSVRTLSAATADDLSTACVGCVENANIDSVAGSKVTGTVANATTATNASQLGGVAANQYVQTNDARLSDARNPLPGSTSYLQINPASQQTGNFSISGNGTVGSLNAVSPSTTTISVETTGTNSGALFGMTAPGQSWLMGTSNSSGNAFQLVEGLTQARMTVRPNGGPILFPTGNVGLGTVTPNGRFFVNGGPTWSNNGWAASIEMTNASAIGWRNNTSNQSFGIGQTNGGLYFFRSPNNPGTTGAAADIDMVITDQGTLGIAGNAVQATDKGGWAKALLFVDGGGTIVRCYNGLTGNSTSTGTTNIGCGFTVTRNGPGSYLVNVGFNLDGRFILVSSHAEGVQEGTAEASNNNPGGTSFGVSTTVNGVSNMDRSFKLAVF